MYCWQKPGSSKIQKSTYNTDGSLAMETLQQTVDCSQEEGCTYGKPVLPWSKQ